MPLAISTAAVCGAGTTGLVRTFSVADVFQIAGLEVGLRLAHPYRSDLSAFLKGPDGTQVTLFSFTKNVLAQNVNARFSGLSLGLLKDDLANQDLSADFGQNQFRPETSLSVFDRKPAAGAWTLTICDRDPASDSGQFYAAALYFQAVQPAMNVSGRWEYAAEAGHSDGRLFAWQVFATDAEGNRSSLPYSLSYQVDNVAPLITATLATKRVFVNSSALVLSGTAKDGASVSRIWVTLTDPLGESRVENVVGSAVAWTYTFTPGLAGAYKLAVYAADPAGNINGQAGNAAGEFSVTAVLPLSIAQSVSPEQNVGAGSTVKYILQVNNPNLTESALNVVVTSTLSQYLTPLSTDGASFANRTLTWPPVTLAAGGQMTLTVLAQMTSKLLITGTLPASSWVDLHGDSIASQAVVRTSNFGVSQANPASFVVAGAAQPAAQGLLLVSKRVTPEHFLQPGVLLTYRIQITNTAAITAQQIVVTDLLNPALTPEALGGASFNPTSRTLTWPAASLAPGKGLTLSFTARVTSDKAVLAGLQGVIPNQALFTSSLGGGTSSPAWALPPYRLFLPALKKTPGVVMDTPAGGASAAASPAPAGLPPAQPEGWWPSWLIEWFGRK